MIFRMQNLHWIAIWFFQQSLRSLAAPIAHVIVCRAGGAKRCGRDYRMARFFFSMTHTHTRKKYETIDSTTYTKERRKHQHSINSIVHTRNSEITQQKQTMQTTIFALFKRKHRFFLPSYGVLEWIAEKNKIEKLTVQISFAYDG